MPTWLKLLLDWSEAWAPLLPIIAFLFKRKQPRWILPLVVYAFIALPYYILIDYLTANEINNTALYHIHACFRLVAVLLFFYFLRVVKRWILVVSFTLFTAGLLLITAYDISPFVANPHVNGDLFTIESFVGLLPCMAFYLYLIQSESAEFGKLKSFWAVTALTIYYVANFFLFLYYNPLIDQDLDRAIRIWNQHNLSYIALCTLLGVALLTNDSGKSNLGKSDSGPS